MYIGICSVPPFPFESCTARVQIAAKGRHDGREELVRACSLEKAHFDVAVSDCTYRSLEVFLGKGGWRSVGGLMTATG